ncbi:MAG: hypothetical protein HY049_19350 [Acidobacteria bacterium]|nr:hypothetical protein [Acidobacteriota bacterium]
MSGSEEAADALRVLTFEAGGSLFAVGVHEVAAVAAAVGPPPPGTSVVDVVGILGRAGAPGPRGCLIHLRSEGAAPPVALTASRAREVIHLKREGVLPLPGFLFQGANPYLGVVAHEGMALFLLAGAESLLRATSR